MKQRFMAGKGTHMDFTTIKRNLERHGFVVSVCKDSAEAAGHMTRELDGETIGFGGSITTDSMGLYGELAKNNRVFWHWKNAEDKARFAEFTAYVTSANAVSETGELVNIDGAGNRVASTLYGPGKVYFLIGKNKIRPDLPSAIDRARNVASPLNAKRLNAATPCVTDLRCHDCNSPGRICGAMVIHMRPMKSAKKTEVVLIDENLGF